MSKHKLLTTGYAGHDAESFLSCLQGHGVKVVVDVRQNPVSRKKGFSRTKLAEFLNANGVEYVHAPKLGVPRDIRQLLRDGECELPEYFDRFREYLTEQDEAIEDLYALASQKRCCLICVEHSSEECHRSVVAKAVAARNGHKLEVVHV